MLNYLNDSNWNLKLSLIQDTDKYAKTKGTENIDVALKFAFF